MTPKQARSTPRSMRALPQLPWVVMLLVACDGAYVLGDAHGTAAGGGSGAAGDENFAGTPPSAAGGAGAALAGQAGEFGAGGAGADSTDPSSIVISPEAIPAARLNTAYRVQFAAHGGVEPYTFSGGGEFPTGLELQVDGQLSGTPNELGAYLFTVHVEDAEGATATAEYELGVNRSRWLAVNSFPSSASTQTLLSLADLTDPTSELVRIESQSAHAATFSPDGRFLIYYAFRSMDAVDWYIVDTASATPSERRFLLTNRYGTSCAWAPDSRKLACPEQSGAESYLVYFDTAGPEFWDKVLLAPADRVAWANANNLVYASGDGEYSRFTFTDDAPSKQPQPLGFSGKRIERQSSDGARAVVIANSSDATRSLVDLMTGQAVELPADPPLTFSDDFSVAVSSDPSDNDPELATYAIYSVSGLDWLLLAQGSATNHKGYSVSAPLFGNRLVVIKGSQLAVEVIDETGVESLVVPGDFPEVRRVQLDPTGRWLYFETGVRLANQQFDPATAQHWLSRIEDEGPAQPIASGFLGGSAAFSIDGQRLYLHGYDSQAEDAVPFLLFDLSDPAQPQETRLQIPLNWAESQWSGDGTYVAFIGGSPALDARPLLVVDALAPSVAPRTILTCSSNPAPLPGCPNRAVFQP